MPTLTATQVRNATLPEGQKQSKRFDTKGLYLLIKASKNPALPPKKWWRLKYRFRKKEKLLSLGTYPEVSLKDARNKRDDALKLLEQGIDPSRYRKTLPGYGGAGGTDTFQAVARAWLAGMSIRWTDSTTDQNTTRLEQFVFPYLGSLPIAEISAPDVLQVLKRIESRGHYETALRVKSLMNRVFQHAVSTGRAQRNPVADIGNAALFHPKVKHRPAITDPREFGELLRSIDHYHGTEIVRSLLQLSPLVFIRPGELRFLVWSEIDWDQSLIRIPNSRMKKGQDHIVPLSRQALAILRDIKSLTGHGQFVFPNARSREGCVSENTVNAAFPRMDYPKGTMTAHGFRTTASTLLHEMGWESDVIERQLAHVEGNKVKAAYNRAEHLEERKKMMQAWADYLDELRLGRKA